MWSWGGDPAAAAAADSWAIYAYLMVANDVPPPPSVVSHIDIRPDEWQVLAAGYRHRLEAIAADLGAHQSEMPSAEADRIVRFARAELEIRRGAQSAVPPHRILAALQSRAMSQYPARYFAANRQERSVNFGLMITYRQIWTPTSYQVGELLKSIPLAPRESCKYSKRLVRKEKRARKEIVSNLTAQKSETQSTSRAEAEIVQKAMEKTNFNATVSGSFAVGVYNAGGSNTLSADAQGDSAETKKNFHEAVVRAAREYKNELKIELETEAAYESESQESGEISNPNDELTVTYLFYELERRYRVVERLHRLQSVVLVAQEVPAPAEIDEDWLIAHRWILNRVLLDDSFKAPLAYVAEGLASEDQSLTELRRALERQRSLVEDLKGEVVDTRGLTESRYAALQRSMERNAAATQRSKKPGGLLGLARSLTSLGVIQSLAGRLAGSDGESPEAARIREAATRDAYERELERLGDLEGRLAQASETLARANEDFADRLSLHIANVVRVAELTNHVKDNILHYMQAIWLHEAPDQRFMRLKDVPVPVLKGTRRFHVNLDAVTGALGNVAHMMTRTYAYRVHCGTVGTGAALPTVPLVEVADIDNLVGFKANYMIFLLKTPNVITSFMMDPYVERAAGGFGLVDPDDLSNLTLDEFSEYVCCLRKHLAPEVFAALHDTLEAQLKTLLQSPLRENEEIVVPLDAMYIEALPGARPILENFKLLHRQIDAADAQERLRLKQLEKLRYARRILDGELGDPEVEAQYRFEGGAASAVVVPAPPATPPGGGGPP